MATKPLPTLPLELVDKILDLTMPSNLPARVNLFDGNGESEYRVHTSDITSLLCICARLRLSHYQRIRAMTVLGTSTTLAIDMTRNECAAMPAESMFNPSSAFHVSDTIVQHINHITFREAFAYIVRRWNHSHVLGSVFCRRLTLALSRQRSYAPLSISSFKWEHVPHYATFNLHSMLAASRWQHEATLRDSLNSRHLPLELWQMSGKVLWLIQQAMSLRDDRMLTQGASYFPASRCFALRRHRVMGQDGSVWELEV